MNSHSKFFTDSATTKVDLEDDQWIELKSEMSIGDWEKYESAMLQIEADTGTNGNRATRRRSIRGQQQQEQSPGKLKLNAGYVNLLEINIASWSFEGVELSRENISKLKAPVTDILIDAIGENNPTNPLGQGSLTGQT
jgi:hypothetical protein